MTQQPPDRFSCSPEPVHVGGSLTIHYTNTGLANTTVTIEIVDTGIGQVVQEQIVLNENGVGAIEWPVPLDWGAFITLEGPDSRDHTVIVTGSARVAVQPPEEKTQPRRERR